MAFLFDNMLSPQFLAQEVHSTFEFVATTILNVFVRISLIS
jgi:hypothetical protein